MIDWTERRAQELNVPLADYEAWLAGYRVESVETAMLRATDAMRELPNSRLHKTTLDTADLDRQ